MNRDLAKYIRTLKDEVAKDIWLDCIIKSQRNGTANIIYKDLMIDYRLTRPQLDKIFNPKEAEKLEVIKVLIDTENFISINFRKGTKQTAGASQERLKSKLENGETGVTITTTPTEITSTAVTIIPAAEHKSNVPAQKGFLMEIPAIYTPTYPLTQAVIGDYIRFFQQLQIDRAALIGQLVTLEQAAKPDITGEDVKHLKELAKYFAKQYGIKNEDQVRRCYHRVYANYWNLSEFLKAKVSPRYIRSNINEIILEIQKLNQNNGKKSDKRENELSSKINAAKSKDNSRLVRSRKGNDT